MDILYLSSTNTTVCGGGRRKTESGIFSVGRRGSLALDFPYVGPPVSLSPEGGSYIFDGRVSQELAFWLACSMFFFNSQFWFWEAFFFLLATRFACKLYE